MRNFFDRIFAGRRGMDELSKTLFWAGLLLYILAVLLSRISAGLGSLLSWLGLFLLIYAFVRAFSRRVQQREAENLLFLRWLYQRRLAFQGFKNRRSQSRDYRFLRCPGCKAILRVPRGKGKIRIHCKCGYTMYRNT